jgi:transcriptional regulator with XRE-family HTH domain
MALKDPIDVVSREMAIRCGRELRLASLGMPQRELARRAGISQAHLSRVLRGVAFPDLGEMVRLVDVAGHRFWFKLMPAHAVGLRDSGQLGLAELIRAPASPAWRFRLEVPVGPGTDLRAADLVMDQPADVNLIEIERGLFDFQAQLRAAQLKRASLSHTLERTVTQVIAVPDTVAARRALAPHAALISAALPIPSRRIWAAIRAGEPIGGDGLLWVRVHSAALRSRPRFSGESN